MQTYTHTHTHSHRYICIYASEHEASSYKDVTEHSFALTSGPNLPITPSATQAIGLTDRLPSTLQVTHKPHHNACCMLTDIRKTKNHYFPLLVGLSIVFSLLCSNRKTAAEEEAQCPRNPRLATAMLDFFCLQEQKEKKKKGHKVCLSLSLSLTHR
jgi:hypothetical protein